MIEEQAILRHAIKGGCLDPRRAVGAGVGAPIVCDGEEDVGRRSEQPGLACEKRHKSQHKFHGGF
jgi:hypothetical protein